MSENDKDLQQPYDTHEETHDIFEIHRQALRERPDPSEGLERPPWWLWAISIILIFWAGFYIGRYGGVFGPEVHMLSNLEKTAVQPPASTTETAEPVADGAGVYARVCVTCHQSNGLGVPGAFPPLAGSEWLLGEADVPAKIVLYGLQGAITVKGSTYNGVMPAWGAQLSDAEIAAVLNYTRSSWGNSAPEIKAETVGAIRKETAGRTTGFTADELKK